jgi:hypothetical protein
MDNINKRQTLGTLINSENIQGQRHTNQNFTEDVNNSYVLEKSPPPLPRRHQKGKG